MDFFSPQDIITQFLQKSSIWQKDRTIKRVATRKRATKQDIEKVKQAIKTKKVWHVGDAKELAEQYNVDCGTIYKHMKQFGAKYSLTAMDVCEYVKAHPNLTLKEIANACNRHEQSVSAIIIKYGLQQYVQYKRREPITLTQADVEGKTRREIMDTYNINADALSKYAKKHHLVFAPAKVFNSGGRPYKYFVTEELVRQHSDKDAQAIAKILNVSPFAVYRVAKRGNIKLPRKKHAPYGRMLNMRKIRHSKAKDIAKILVAREWCTNPQCDKHNCIRCCMKWLTKREKTS